jgi:hypothetical protein
MVKTPGPGIYRLSPIYHFWHFWCDFWTLKFLCVSETHRNSAFFCIFGCIFLNFFYLFTEDFCVHLSAIFLCVFFCVHCLRFFASSDRRRRYRDNIGYPRYGATESYNIGDNQYSSKNLSYCPINRLFPIRISIPDADSASGIEIRSPSLMYADRL